MTPKTAQRIREVNDDAWTPSLVALLRELWLVDPPGEPAHLPEEQRDELLAVPKMLADGRLRAWIAIEMQDLLGCITMTDGTIDNLYVRGPHRRNGVGGQLLAAAQTAGANDVTLPEGNEAAVAFFTSHGWIEPERKEA